MKVSELKEVVTDNRAQQVLVKKPGGTQAGQSFKFKMTEMNNLAYQQYIDKLKEDIIRQGDVLKQKTDISELQKYRGLITELINETVSNSFACKTTTSFDPSGRRRVFVVIRNINEKLDALTQEVLSDQKDNIKLASTVDDIRGLLVDLLM